MCKKSSACSLGGLDEKRQGKRDNTQLEDTTDGQRNWAEAKERRKMLRTLKNEMKIHKKVRSQREKMREHIQKKKGRGWTEAKAKGMKARQEDGPRTLGKTPSFLLFFSKSPFPKCSFGATLRQTEKPRDREQGKIDRGEVKEQGKWGGSRAAHKDALTLHFQRERKGQWWKEREKEAEFEKKKLGKGLKRELAFQLGKHLRKIDERVRKLRGDREFDFWESTWQKKWKRKTQRTHEKNGYGSDRANWEGKRKTCQWNGNAVFCMCRIPASNLPHFSALYPFSSLSRWFGW